MVGKNKSLLKLNKNAQGESPQKIFDIDCPFHSAHLCAQKGAKASQKTFQRSFNLVF